MAQQPTLKKNCIAITLRRPWDQAILHGNKTIENRTWPLPVGVIGQPILLHAGRKYDADGAAWMKEMNLYDPPAQKISPVGLVGVVVFDRVVHKDNCVDQSITNSPWFSGPYGWVVKTSFELERPIPCVGEYGLWTPPESIFDEVLRIGLKLNNTQQTHDTILAEVASWPAEWREDFEERAAIMEHDGSLDRKCAEIEAWRLLRERFNETK